MKAVIEEFGIAFIKTHNLQTLFLKIEGLLPFSLNELIISELDRLYLDARYPGDFGLMPYGKPTIDEAEMYYQEALDIKQKVETFLVEHVVL